MKENDILVAIQSCGSSELKINLGDLVEVKSINNSSSVNVMNKQGKQSNSSYKVYFRLANWQEAQAYHKGTTNIKDIEQELQFIIY